MLVVEVAGVIVGEDFVGLRDGFEGDVGLFALFGGDFVGVGGEGGLGGVVLVGSAGGDEIDGRTLW